MSSKRNYVPAALATIAIFFVGWGLWLYAFASLGGGDTMETVTSPLMPTDDKYYARADLAAQREMARWTLIMGMASVAGIILSFVGVVFIWRTWETSKDAAKASRGTLEAYLAIERGRLVVFIDDVRFRDGQAKVNIGVTNVGKSSCVVTQLTWCWSSDRRWPQNEVFIGPPRHVLVKESATECLGFIRSDELENLVLQGIVKYRSPLGDDHRTYFAFEIFRSRDLPHGLYHRELHDMPKST